MAEQTSEAVVGDSRHADILKTWVVSKTAWQDIHADYVSDQQFADGEQWDAKVKQARITANLSVLVYNQIPSKYKYIVNNFRRNVPGVKVHPISDGANANTARVFDGILKYLQHKHNAKQAYAHALTCAVIGGIGAWKVVPVRDRNGEYDIEIQRILDPTTVFVDPNAIRQDFSDAKYVFQSFWISREQFKSDYGEDAEVSDIGEATRGMFTKDSVQLLEYWCLNDETGYWEQTILSGSTILSENNEYRGKYMPIILLTGEEKHVDNQRTYKGIVRDVVDMQILLNLSKSKTADYIARSSNQQWLAEAAQIEGFEELWLSSNVNGVPVLPYNATAAGAPQRLEAPSPPAGFMQISTEADNDIRQAVGIRDPLEAMPSNVAQKTVEMQVSQSNVGTYEYIDRVKDMIKYGAQVILDLIPYYFGYPHMREIMGIDSQVTTIPVNVPYDDNGEVVMHDLASGRYGVSISDGPSYDSQRSEASDKLMQLAQAYPQFMQLAGDILFRNFDFDGASEIADRLRSQIPPEILAASTASNGDGSANAGNKQALMQSQMQQLNMLLQQSQAQIAQQQQQIQALTMDIQTETTKQQTRMQVDLALKAADLRNQRELLQMQQRGKLVENDQKIAAERESDLLENHTDIFVAELKHGAQSLTAPVDPSPRIIQETTP